VLHHTPTEVPGGRGIAATGLAVSDTRFLSLKRSLSSPRRDPTKGPNAWFGFWKSSRASNGFGPDPL